MVIRSICQKENTDKACKIGYIGVIRTYEKIIRNLFYVLYKNEINGTVCELGIGTNEAAILNGIILEDEKVYGTVHIAFGTNTSFGGTNKAECHMDGIILRPTLYLDDTKVIENGVFLI